MKKIVKVMVVLLGVFVLGACGSNSKGSDSKITKISNEETKTSAKGPESPLKDKYLTDLSSEKNQYWFIDGTYRGKKVDELSKVTWKDAGKTECFTILESGNALFGTVSDGNIVNARVYKVVKKDDNGFFALKQIRSVVSESYLNSKIKEADRGNYKEVKEAGFQHAAPEKYYASEKSNIAKATAYVRFYNVDGKLYRENAGSKDQLVLYRLTK